MRRLRIWQLNCCWTIFGLLSTLVFGEPLPAEDSPAANSESAAKRGYRWLRTRPYLPADFDQEVFDDLWKIWPEEERAKAENANLAERRRLTFSRYGLMEDPDRPNGPALGYVDDGQGGWVMNCLNCHAGQVAGKVIPGLPNSHLALQSLTEDVRLTKLRLRKKLSHLDLGTLSFPLGTTNGSTNSVIFGVLLSNLRDKNMKIDRSRPTPDVEHHDMDAPPFWNVKKKTRLYIDGHIAKTHRPLMQFMLLPINDEKTVKAWEPEFRDILAWIESVEPPRWPWNIDQELAERGERIFHRNCAECHGSYGAKPTYPERTVPIEEIGTDPVRLRALTKDHLKWVKDGWVSRYGEDFVDDSPAGYVAPPLDGLWASAPYFHNGSVPTLWHVLNPEKRPAVWKRSEAGYDQTRVGLEVQEFEDIPGTITQPAERRRYFDTRKKGKSAAGHDFPSVLTDDEKRAVLEYLKTL